jgi:hypothetical protein
MGNDQGSAATVRVKKQARPWSGFFLGLLLGLAIAVLLQQAGVWPLDRLLVFGSAGVFALIGILMGGAGRERARAFSNIVPLVLAVALIGWGATGIAEINESGQINGGCAVQAESSVDSTRVTDTSRQDPFQVDPEGRLSWSATSPAPITNHLWEIYVDIGGFPVVIASNVEAEPNTDGDTENVGDVADVSAYVAEVSDYTGLELDGVFEVGGSIEGEGGACDGFGFVELTADPLTTLISQIAAGVGLLALISLLVLALSRTREAAVIPEQVVVDDDVATEVDEADIPDEVDGTSAGAAAGTAAGATRGGAHLRTEDAETEDVPKPPDNPVTNDQPEPEAGNDD